MTDKMVKSKWLNGLVKLRYHPLFELVVVFIIVFSALIAGVKTFSVFAQYHEIFIILDYVVTSIFLLELLIRIMSEASIKHFIKNGWNIFDSVIVFISLIPINNAELAIVGRMLRIFRIMRIISFIPDLRLLVTSLFQLIPKLAYIFVLLFIFFFIYGTVGATFFAEINPDLWGNVAIAMLTLFRIMTLEGWSDVMYETMEIYSSSWVFFVSFIIITAFAFLNLLIGVIVTVIDKETRFNDAEKNSRAHRENDLLMGIERLENRLKSMQEK